MGSANCTDITWKYLGVNRENMSALGIICLRKLTPAKEIEKQEDSLENTNHLSQYGRDVILLERGEVACGASGHAPASSSLNVWRNFGPARRQAATPQPGEIVG